MLGGGQHQIERRDHEALASLSRQYGGALHRYFLRRRLSKTEAEDAVQDVFTRLARKTGLAELENLEGYIFETAASVATDLFRRQRTRALDQHVLYDDALHARSAVSPEDVHQGRAEIAVMVRALRELPERTRHAFVLARMEGLAHQEIGKRLGISVSAVEKHVIKATAHLALRTGRR